MTSSMRKGNASAVTHYGGIGWASEAAEGVDERGAGARGSAPARARSAHQQGRSEGAPFWGPFCQRFRWRFARRDPPGPESPRSPPWRQIRASGESRHRWMFVSSSTRSRVLRGRRRVNSRRVLDLARHLTERDLKIAEALFEHRSLTTDQLVVLFFSSRRRAQDRLLFLHRHGLVDRFYPAGPFGLGKPAAHWLLDDAGAVLVAARFDVERRKLGWERRQDWGGRIRSSRTVWRSTGSSPV